MIFDIDNWREITATLSRNKTRTFLTAFGIFWGTAMLALLWGGGQGMQGMMKSNFDGFATNSMIIFPDKTTMPYKGYQKGMWWSLTTEDIASMRNMVPELDIISPVASKYTKIHFNDRNMDLNVNGVAPTFMDVLNPHILQGRFINASDMAQCKKVCVIGKNVARYLFGYDDPIGQFVRMDNVYYRVVGVMKQRSEISFNGRLDDSAIIPISTGQRTYNIGNQVNFLALVAKQGHLPGQLKDQIFKAIRQNHPLHPEDTKAVFWLDASEMFEQVENVFSGIDVLILFVGLSSLIAGIIGVGNIMWIIVKERTKEFGIRRALGAKPRSVMYQILSESALLTTVAGTAGICFAVLILGVVSPAISQGSGLPTNFQLSFTEAVMILVLFLTLGTAAGTIPALKALKIKPIEALNDK